MDLVNRRRGGGRAGGVPEVRAGGVAAGSQGEPWPRTGERPRTASERLEFAPCVLVP